MGEVKLLTVHGKVKKGQLFFDDQLRFKEQLKGFPDMNVSLILVKRERGFTNNQRNYYFSAIVPHVHHLLTDEGHFISKKEVDDLLREKFLYREFYDNITEQWKRIPCRLSDTESDVTKDEFTRFLENVSQWCAEEFNSGIPSNE